MTVRETPATLLATLIAATMALSLICAVTLEKAWGNFNHYRLNAAENSRW